jgi:hypothetical protein
MGTVMSRLHRGRAMLQRRLQQYAIDQGYIQPTAQGEDKDATALTELQTQLACA